MSEFWHIKPELNDDTFDINYGVVLGKLSKYLNKPESLEGEKAEILMALEKQLRPKRYGSIVEPLFTLEEVFLF